MSAYSRDEIILITVSWQALKRIEGLRKPEFFPTDSIVVKFFAATYIEASLNYLISKLKIKTKMEDFFVCKEPICYLGLRNKLAFFYNEFVASPKAQNKDELVNPTRGFCIDQKLDNTFTDFSIIKDFRDDIAHGFVNHIDKSDYEVLLFRNNAKAIVQKLIDIAGNKLKDADKITYLKAIDYDDKKWGNLVDYPKLDNSSSS